jgi:hypothetical protein
VSDIVWIPALPLPFFGFFAVRCHCGHWFVSIGEEKRMREYELHWRRVHDPEERRRTDDGPRAQVGVARDVAERIYAEAHSL